MFSKNRFSAKATFFMKSVLSVKGFKRAPAWAVWGGRGFLDKLSRSLTHWLPLPPPHTPAPAPTPKPRPNPPTPSPKPKHGCALRQPFCIWRHRLWACFKIVVLAGQSIGRYRATAGAPGFTGLALAWPLPMHCRRRIHLHSDYSHVWE